EPPHHPHLAARATILTHPANTHPAPPPRFSATPAAVRGGPALPGAHTESVARDWAVPALHDPPAADGD
ncbi:CoA transferase, partial [Streptomyces sp. NPDC127190]